MSLSLEVKNHRLIFADSEQRQALFITEQKANTIRHFLKDRSSTYIDLTDDRGNYSETLQKRLIKRIELIKDNPDDKNRRWICGFGTRHALGTPCECKNRFGILDFVFMQWCQKFYNINYIHQITYEMQSQFLKHNNS